MPPMIELTPLEARVLGTLIEKAQTVPGQYPLTLNGLVVGCNQKNNRDPVTNLSEDDCLRALDGLKSKGLVREALMAGSRVHKFRHVAREGLGVSTAELVVLAELMLRGPQAAGELRGRAARMMPPDDVGLQSLESATAVLEGLSARAEPLVRRLVRRPGERAERWAQLIAPAAHPLDGPVTAERVVMGDGAAARGGDGGSDAAVAQEAVEELRGRVAALEGEVAALRAMVERLTG
ncbi:MAG: YceH family protein [Planctomycetota bacterium]|nr:YceH family protein [Planctomycetota bacterium]